MRPLAARIDTSALSHNLTVAKRLAGAARVLAVIKANGYGHGLLRTAHAMQAADGFAVLTLDEAIRLREAGYRHPIILLEGFFQADEIPEIVHHRLQPVIHRADQIDALARARLEPGIDLFLKVDSGMHRLGFQPEAVADALDRLKALSGVGGVTLMSHFARSEEGGEFIRPQLEVFGRATEGLDLPVSLANSAALMRHPETLREWVRPGIMLYGVSPFPEETGETAGLRPVMTLSSEIIAIQPVRKGEGVGYGHLFNAPHDMRVGIVACGYGDGYPRHALTGTPVRIEGQSGRTVGRVSMDMLHVDLTGIEGVRIGSPVTLWGDGCPAEKVAAAAGTTAYELLTALTARVRIEES